MPQAADNTRHSVVRRLLLLCAFFTFGACLPVGKHRPAGANASKRYAMLRCYAATRPQRLWTSTLGRLDDVDGQKKAPAAATTESARKEGSAEHQAVTTIGSRNGIEPPSESDRFRDSHYLLRRRLGIHHGRWPAGNHRISQSQICQDPAEAWSHQMQTGQQKLILSYSECTR